MNESWYSFIAIIFGFLFLFYINKWDLVDMTGLAKKRAIKGMPALSKRLKMKHDVGRTDLRQGELSFKTKQYEVNILADHNRISVIFNRPLGIYLLSGKDQRKSGRPENLQDIIFSKNKLNEFFKEQLIHSKTTENGSFNNSILEESLVEFIEKFKGRKFTNFSLRDDTLHIIFAYRDYLPLPLIEEATPKIINIANALISVNRDNTTNNP